MTELSKPNPNLITVLEAPATFAAGINAHGPYNTLQFVLRLSPRIHQLLDAVPSGTYSAGGLDGETILAYSTYLHETVHWWQHMGSTTGPVLSGPSACELIGEARLGTAGSFEIKDRYARAVAFRSYPEKCWYDASFAVPYLDVPQVFVAQPEGFNALKRFIARNCVRRTRTAIFASGHG
jgi:hypothetical protein